MQIIKLLDKVFAWPRNSTHIARNVIRCYISFREVSVILHGQLNPY